MEFVRYGAIAFAAFGLVACQSSQGTGTAILSSEPDAGTLRTGAVVYVDNGSCRAGEVLKVTGSVPGRPREKECVARPA